MKRRNLLSIASFSLIIGLVSCNDAAKSKITEEDIKAVETAKELANFLYKINFLTARKTLESGEIQRKYFEENRYLSHNLVDFGYDWEIHPAFRWALQPDDIESIFRNVCKLPNFVTSC